MNLPTSYVDQFLLLPQESSSLVRPQRQIFTFSFWQGERPGQTQEKENDKLHKPRLHTYSCFFDSWEWKLRPSYISLVSKWSHFHPFSGQCHDYPFPPLCFCLLFSGLQCTHCTLQWRRQREKKKVSLTNHLLRWVRSTPHPVTVTTRNITFLVGNPYKPSFATVTGWGVDPRDGVKSSNQSKVLNPQRGFPPIDFTYPKNPSPPPPPMEKPDPPSLVTPRFQGLQTGGNLTPHDIPRILRVQKEDTLYVEKK